MEPDSSLEGGCGRVSSFYGGFGRPMFVAGGNANSLIILSGTRCRELYNGTRLRELLSRNLFTIGGNGGHPTSSIFSSVREGFNFSKVWGYCQEGHEG